MVVVLDEAGDFLDSLIIVRLGLPCASALFRRDTALASCTIKLSVELERAGTACGATHLCVNRGDVSPHTPFFVFVSSTATQGRPTPSSLVVGPLPLASFTRRPPSLYGYCELIVEVRSAHDLPRCQQKWVHATRGRGAA